MAEGKRCGREYGAGERKGESLKAAMGNGEAVGLVEIGVGQKGEDIVEGVGIWSLLGEEMDWVST